MPIQEYEIASGVRVHGGVTGIIYSNSGRIMISRAAKIGVDSNLWACLKIAVDTLHIAINVNSIDTGEHVPTSRHYTGRAVDIDHVGPMLGALEAATLENPHALRLARWLLSNGFHIGEGGPWAAVIFGPVHTTMNPTDINHAGHMHVSVPRA